MELLHPLFVLLTCLCFIYWTAHCEVQVEESAEVPFRSLCSRKCESPIEKTSDEDFPLYQCSCSESCSTYGDCCVDSAYKNTNDYYANFVCLSLIDHGKYKAVYGCPSNKQSDSCTEGLGHLPPVTSRKTNVTYANIFCAECNGDGEDLVTWNVELSCPSKFMEEVANPSNDENRIITRFGDIWMVNESGGSKRCMFRVHFNDSRFLEDLELRPCSNARKISRCSSSWNELDTMQMCRSYEDPVYFHNTMYKNAHCAACNYLNPERASCMPFHLQIKIQRGFVDSKMRRFCRTRGSEACIETLSNRHKGRQYSFADLLNIREKACVPPSGRRCCEGQSFDFRFQRCKKMVRG